MSHPKTVDKFIPWSKAMVAGATVDKPNYGKTKTKPSAKYRRPARASRKRASRKRKNNAKKD